MDGLALDQVDLIADGLSTPLALAIASKFNSRVRRLVLDAVALPEPDLRTEMKVNYLPDLRPQMDGTHLHRCWHMLRDQAVQWPWYDGGSGAARKITPDLQTQDLHIRLVDTLKQWNHAGDAIAAVLDVDGRACLGAITAPTLVLETEDDVRYRWVDEAVSGLAQGRATSRPADTAARARAVLSFLEG